MPRSFRIAPPPHPRRRPRAGVTLVEIVVATTLLGFALLTLAAGMAAALRALTDSRLESETAWRAARRLERLRALPCAARVDGSEVAGGMLERWSVEPRPDAAATRLAVAVRPADGRVREREFVTVAPC